MQFSFVFQTEEDWRRAIRALDMLSLNHKGDARNPQLPLETREKAAKESADAYRLARELHNLSSAYDA